MLDAVPEGGRVRFIRIQGAPEGSAGAAVAPRISALAGLKISPGQARFEDGFMVLLREANPNAKLGEAIVLDTKVDLQSDKVVVQVRGLLRKFGSFTAVDHVDFECAAVGFSAS